MVLRIFSLNKLNKGFTLMELLVVIGLLGILITAGIASYTGSQKTARDGKRKTDLETLRQTLELYRSDNTTTGYPNFVGDTETTIKTPLTSPIPYISTSNFPKDPASNLGYYYYYNRTAANTYYICSYLENTPVLNTCPAVVDCNTAMAGNQTCNYGVTQP